MATMTHDGGRATAGLGLAVVSAASFGMSGPAAATLMAAGWSPAAAVAARVGLAGLVLLGPALGVLRGRWGLVRRELGGIVAFGVVAVAGCQLGYFSAVRHLPVGVALLTEYAAPVAVVAWMWLHHGQRPGGLTGLGGGSAVIGLLLVLDVFGSGGVSVVGLAWALVAMLGVAFYFVRGSRESVLPPVVLAAGGLLVGCVTLVLAALVRLVPWSVSTADVHVRGSALPWWLPVVVLGVVTAALAYVSGIAASRRLGARLASFVALLEVLFGVVYACLLLAQVPHPIQLLGAVLVLVGVVLVKLGEPALAVEEPTPVAAAPVGLV